MNKVMSRDELWYCPDCKKEYKKDDMVFSGMEGACKECWKKRMNQF